VNLQAKPKKLKEKKNQKAREAWLLPNRKDNIKNQKIKKKIIK
jgi:hypothetical protein